MRTRAQYNKDLKKRQMERNKLPKRCRGTGGKAPRKQIFNEKQLPPIKLRISKTYNSKFLGPPKPEDNLEHQSDQPIDNQHDDLPPLVRNEPIVNQPDVKTEPVDSEQEFLPALPYNQPTSQNQSVKIDKETQTVLCTCCSSCSLNALGI